MCPKSLNKQSSEYLWDAGLILGHIEEEHLAEDMTFYEASRQIYCSKNRQADVVKNMIKQIFDWAIFFQVWDQNWRDSELGSWRAEAIRKEQARGPKIPETNRSFVDSVTENSPIWSLIFQMINLPVTAAVTPREVLKRVDSNCLVDEKSHLMCNDFFR